MAPATRKRDTRPDAAIPLRDLLKLSVSILGALGGLTAFLSFMGFVIALSFISSQGLYGIPNFAEQFFKEAAVKFVDDLFVVLHGWRVLAFLLLLALLFCLTLLTRAARSEGNQGFWRHGRRVLAVGYPIFLCAAAVGAIALLFMLDSDFAKIKSNGAMLYWICLPVFLGVLLYLLFHARDLSTGSRGGKIAYSGFLLLFVALALSLPFSYGRNVFDFPVYKVSAIDSHAFSEGNLGRPEGDSPLSAMMRAFGSARRQDDVVRAEDFRVYYVMFHTSGKEVFIVPGSAEYTPLKFVLVDENLTSFLELIASVDSGSGPTTVNYTTFRFVLAQARSAGSALPGEPFGTEDYERYDLEELPTQMLR